MSVKRKIFTIFMFVLLVIVVFFFPYLRRKSIAKEIFNINISQYEVLEVINDLPLFSNGGKYKLIVEMNDEEVEKYINENYYENYYTEQIPVAKLRNVFELDESQISFWYEFDLSASDRNLVIFDSKHTTATATVFFGEKKDGKTKVYFYYVE